jgi:choline transport protein
VGAVVELGLRMDQYGWMGIPGGHGEQLFGIYDCGHSGDAESRNQPAPITRSSPTHTGQSYVPKDWHNFLVYLALMLLIFCVNAFGNALLPHVNKFALVWSLLGFVIISITALACAAPNFQSANFVFGGVINATEWPTGLAWMIGLLQGTLSSVSPPFLLPKLTSPSLIGYDAPSHLSEEIPNPRKNVPRTMVGAVLIGTLSGFLLCLSLLFAAPSLDAVLSAPEGPVLHILSSATGSQAAAVALIIFPLLCLIMGTASIMTTASRLVWAFARDGGVPFSPWLARVHAGLAVPLNALLATLAVVVVYGLLFFAGEAALNALVSASVVSSLVSYAFPVVVNMCGGRKGLPRDRLFRMPEMLAWTVNGVGVLFTALTTVLFCLPPGGPRVGVHTFSKFEGQ